MTSEEVWGELRGRVASPPEKVTLPVLIDFFEAHRDLFYEVAVVGVPMSAAPWAKELARLADQVRRHIRAGYEVVEDQNGGEIRSSGVPPLSWRWLGADEVRTFLMALNGVRVRKVVPSVAAYAEVEFRLGELPA